MRIIISAGHDKKKQGATNKVHGISEYNITEKVVLLIKEKFEQQFPDDELIVLNHDFGDKLSEVVKLVNKIHNEKKVDCAVEVHFNALEDLTIKGSEVLYASAQGFIYAEKLNRSICSLTGEKYRRVFNPLNDKKENESVRDYIKGFIHKTEPVALISEAGFISNNETAEKLKDINHLNKIADAHIELFAMIQKNKG